MCLSVTEARPIAPYSTYHAASLRKALHQRYQNIAYRASVGIRQYLNGKQKNNGSAGNAHHRAS
jgi:hypothetical protein